MIGTHFNELFVSDVKLYISMHMAHWRAGRKGLLKCAASYGRLVEEDSQAKPFMLNFALIVSINCWEHFKCYVGNEKLSFKNVSKCKWNWRKTVQIPQFQQLQCVNFCNMTRTRQMRIANMLLCTVVFIKLQLVCVELSFKLYIFYTSGTTSPSSNLYKVFAQVSTPYLSINLNVMCDIVNCFLSISA